MAEESSAAEKKDKPKQEGSVKETIESILVAFILAFIFRAFVVEAFVIPTGSMGPTLMGAHLRLQCPDCGYQFALNFSQGHGDDTDIPSAASFGQNVAAVCPNCGYQIPLSGVQPVYFGDRILVLKYRYLFQQPARWDVVVFKSPYEKNPDPNDPKYTDNYIKRLIGKPNESVMILDGDIYIGSKGMPPEQFKIQRKPRHAQEALWRDVYDNDYLPHEDRVGWQEPWVVESGSGWNGPQGTGTPPRRIFRFENPKGASALRFDSLANHSFDSLTDWIAYDQVPGPAGTNSYVSDLKLTCVYRRTAGQGPLRLQMTKRGECFTAELAPGKVRLYRNKLINDQPLKLGADIWGKPLEADVPELNATGSPVEIEFTNVDYRVTVRLNGRDVLKTTDDQYWPNIAELYKEALADPRTRGRSNADRPAIQILADSQTCSIEHLHLARDVYYLNTIPGQGHLTRSNGYSGEPFWASPELIQNLGPDEYFVLGDNSLVSLDARFWGEPVDLPGEGKYFAGPGRVPGRFMLGKAFFVYWPAGYRPENLSFGIRPDFGDMRFIH
jgi:signal peptidase I